MNARDVALAGMSEGAAQKLGEFVQLVQLVHDHRPAVVLEIGTLTGGTLKAWCEATPDSALVVSVDLPGGEWGGGYTPEQAERIRGFARPGQRVELIQGDSQDPAVFATVLDVLRGRPVDFLFIDGDHSLEGVTADFDEYGQLVTPGGLIAFHDITVHTQVPDCRVSELWARVAPSWPARTWEFVVDGDERTWGPWAGIGVLQVPE